MKTTRTDLMATVDIPDDTAILDFTDESTMLLSELTDAFQYPDPFDLIDAAERAFGAPYALIGDWKWSAIHQG